MTDNNMMFAPRFSWLKTRMQNFMREDHYFDILLQSDLQMFTYSGLPEDIDPVWLEKYLNVAGSAAIVRTPLKYQALMAKAPDYLVAPDPARNGELDQYGDGTHIAGATHNGYAVTGTIGEDAVIIYNRSTRMPEIDLMIDADQLMQIDKSTYVNVLLSRIAPIYSCATDNARKAIDAMLNEVLSGSVKTIVSGNIADILKIEDGVKLLDVTQPEKIQYVQYLSQLYDVILRRHYNRRGLSVRTGTKAAQQSTDEIHGLDAVSWILPLAKLEARKKGMEDLNKVFGTSASVSFSEIWQQEYDAYLLRIMQQDVQSEEVISDDAAQIDENEGDPDGAEGTGSDGE